MTFFLPKRRPSRRFLPVRLLINDHLDVESSTAWGGVDRRISLLLLLPFLPFDLFQVLRTPLHSSLEPLLTVK